SLTVVIVPFANAALLHRAPERKVLVGTAIVTCGMLLLSGADFTSLNPGALIMLLSAFVYAGHIIVAKRFVEEVDPLALGVWQLGFGGLFSGIAAFTFGGFTLPGTPGEVVVVVALALICSAYGFITQTLVQPHVPAETTGFAFSLEPVCSAVFSFFLVGEVLSPIAFLGAALILTGVMAATVELPHLRAHGRAHMAGVPERAS
ncbi:MAG: DMT family transporter, partial [Collinsella sp.]|nr:DMT family transporter [Collinsella sp.]